MLKRELLAIRRATSPAREVLNQLTNRELAVIAPEHVVYFRDVYDHLIRVTDELDNYRDLVSGTLEIYLSTVNNNLSTDHEAADRGDRDPRRDRRGRRDLRDERGRARGRERRGDRVLDHHRVSILIAAVIAAVVLRRMDWICAGPAASPLRADDRVGLRVGLRGVGRAEPNGIGEDLEDGRGALRSLGRLQPERLLVRDSGSSKPLVLGRGGGPR